MLYYLIEFGECSCGADRKQIYLIDIVRQDELADKIKKYTKIHYNITIYNDEEISHLINDIKRFKGE